MYPILAARRLAADVKLFEIEAPYVARKRQAGQFVILRVHERGERIPLTIADASLARGSVTLVVQGIGKTTKLLNTLEAGDAMLDVVGPLGRPSEIELYGTAVVVGGGVGTAIAYPTAVALKAAGNRVIAIIGGRTRDLVILEDEVRATSDVIHVTTDDGSYGEKGLVTDRLQAHGIKTVVSLNSIMVDGTGMCGGCRVQVGKESRFACVDGPEFDAHQVDFAVLSQRNAMYRAAEARSLEAFAAHPERDRDILPHTCRLEELAQ